MKVGDVVQMRWNDGLGGTILYGLVTKAGSKAFDVLWESGTTNRLRQDDLGDLKPARDRIYAIDQMRQSMERHGLGSERLAALPTITSADRAAYDDPAGSASLLADMRLGSLS